MKFCGFRSSENIIILHKNHSCGTFEKTFDHLVLIPKLTIHYSQHLILNL
jgi:hypothetical protein